MSAVVASVIVGTGVKMYAAKRAGDSYLNLAEAERSEKYFEAAQYDVNAVQAVAAGQRKALEEKRVTDLVASRALALAGTGAGDKSVVNIIASLKSEGSYRAMVAMYEGEEVAREMRTRGTIARMEGEYALQAGEARFRASRLEMLGDLIGGATTFSLYKKFGAV